MSSLRNFACISLGAWLAGCGLTLDTTLDPDAGGGVTADAGGAADAAAPMDAAQPPDDAGVPPPGDATVTPDDAGADAACADADGDGVSTCEGDCDDGDPTVHPGAPMICGDGVDNGCLGVAGDEAACMGIGTYVSERTGAPGNPGTQALPVLTIMEAQNNAIRIGGGVDVYVATGTYPESVRMVDRVAVRCGYEASGWTRDIAAHVATIAPPTPAGVVFGTGTGPETELEGCTVVGQPGVSSSAAVSFDAGSSGTLSLCTVRGGDNESGRSIAISIYAAGSDVSAVDNAGLPLIADNQIHLGRARNWSGSLPAATFGILAFRTNASITGNRIELADMQTAQRAIDLRRMLPGAKVWQNVIRPSGGRSDNVAGISIVGGAVEISRNDVFAGPCVGWCMSVEILGAPTELVIRNNQIYAGPSETSRSSGIAFEAEGLGPGDVPNVLVHSNLVVGAARGTSASAIAFLGAPTHVRGGRVLSNILYGGNGPGGYAIYELNDRYDPERLEANMLFLPSTGGALGAALYLDEGVVAISRIADVLLLPEHGSVPSRNDGCAVIDPRPDGDPHLPSTSSCVDMGTGVEGPPDDFEGDPRPSRGGYDPGLDEVP